MSFGSETGRTRSGTKGFSGKANKKLKRKKQEYHTHRRVHLQESERPNPEEVRSRTIIALDRLGHQRLSTEPGGYDLDDWLRSLNSLLDDFQEKVGAERIPDEFRNRLQLTLLSLAAPSSSSEIDVETEKLTQDEAAANAALEELERQEESRLASLREERDACARELKIEKARLAEIKEARQSRQFFSRLMRTGPSTDQAEGKIVELESKLSRLEEEIERSRKAVSAFGGSGPGPTGSAHIEAQQKLESIRKRLLDLQNARQSTLQLAREREIATKEISDSISSLKLGETQPSESVNQAP